MPYSLIILESSIHSVNHGHSLLTSLRRLQIWVGAGGVAPDLRVPKTLENLLAFAAGTDVELQYAVEHLRGY
jgi:hypothetical protein